ncbi:biopolymer transporter ExbD [Ferrovum sp. PN-J185]|uniref:ExbD/TolR family protein n=1 Tax=Ferrovum sp. PN-J185 TaxID=1356306 RepID=UPI000792E975|nr:biopolymer transporter ExbD [Ferrovum sp. PN-J185]KXW55739.1 biopolymer transport protein ExbD [Ferrovum sp. PN-J185]MCC6068563.1 biopolymer transporter ExbD [Ferrovum sp. PN-J185]MDE1892124.1 biopolymer transporter ExbD [Betaproteobacteria bacterium]
MDFRRGQRREDPEINLIPMIDILLVILIFLMVSSTFVHQHGLNINLPLGSTKNNELTKDQVIEVDMDQQGMVSVDHHLWSNNLSQLSNLVVNHLNNKTNTYVIIRADKNLSHGKVMEIVSDFQQIGFNHFTLVTEDSNH